jgi:pimeloyl-ACP methyl ester carboxylesterase
MTPIRRALDSFMTDTIVLLHGGATGSSSWNPVARALISSGASVFAPDMLGCSASPASTGSYAIPEEVAHLPRLLGLQPTPATGPSMQWGSAARSIYRYNDRGRRRHVLRSERHQPELLNPKRSKTCQNR